MRTTCLIVRHIRSLSVWGVQQARVEHFWVATFKKGKHKAVSKQLEINDKINSTIYNIKYNNHLIFETKIFSESHDIESRKCYYCHSRLCASNVYFSKLCIWFHETNNNSYFLTSGAGTLNISAILFISATAYGAKYCIIARWRINS